MDKKKAGLLIIVLFLIIGLGSFVFANPDNQENFEEGDIEEREDQGSDSDRDNSSSDDEESDDVLTTESDNQNDDDNDSRDLGRLPGNTLGNGNGSTYNPNEGTGTTTGPNGEVPTVQDTSYSDALKAVEQAESSLVQGDVDYAASLVDKVTDESGKEELTNRLEAVQNIIDVTELVETLENKVTDSASRDDILSSIDYRDDNKIEELVSNLNNESVKDDLTNRLETVNKILNDNEGPVISGIDNNSFTKENVKLTISDENEVTTTVMLNGNQVDYTDEFTTEGTYVVTVVDAAFNETTWTFTIDKTKPVVGGVEDGKYYNTDVAVTIDDANPGTVHLRKDGELVKPYNAGDLITEEGTYTVVVTDKAGNKSKEITFVIDKHVEDAKWVYILNVSDANNRKTIRNGQTLRVEVNFDEELTELPVLTIGDSQSTTFRKCNETDYGKYVCVADITIDNTVANLEDGKEIPFTVTNIIDKAGNTITLDNSNVTYTKNYGQVTYDETAPVVKTLGITDINEYTDEVGKLYAKNGDTVRVMIYFDEKLGTEPTVELGGKEFTATYRSQSSRPEDNHYAYYADIKLTEDMNLSDGVIPFTVYGYKDEIGNEGVKLTEADVNSEAYPSVTIDNTKAKVLELKFHSSNENNQYAKPGDWFGVYLIVDEQLKENPTFIVNGVEYTANQFEENGGNYKYAVVYEIPSNTSVGEMTFEISNIKDLAGNVTDDLDNSDTDMSITYDNVSPGPKILGITGFFNENEDAHYITYGKKVRVLTYYNEKLGTNPIVKIGNKEFETYYTEASSDLENGIYAYYADITITEDLGLSEGEITFTVYGHKDLAGNEGRAYTNADITYNEKQEYEKRFDKVILDNSNPVFTTVMNGHQYNVDTEIQVEDLSLKSIEVYYYEDDTTETVENGYVLTKEGTYRITATDYTGRSTTVYVEIDKTAPSITGFEDNSYNDGNEIVYVRDENLYKVTINGTEYEHDGKYFEEKFGSDGTYVVVATDRAGNSTTKTVTVDKTDPVFTTVMNGHQYNTDKEITVEDNNLDTIEVYYYEDDTTEIVENGYVLTKEGTYRITATDKAGRSETVYIEIDKTAPSITGFEDNYYNNKTEIVYVRDENLYKVTINGTEYEHDGKYFEKKFTSDGTYVVVATDKAGNSTTKTVTVDKTSPVITINGEEFTGTDNAEMFYNSVEFNITEANDYTLTVNDKEVTLEEAKEMFTKDGEYTVEVKDAAGNKTTVKFTVDTIPVALVNIRVNSNNANKDVAKVGDKIGIYLNVNEELRENPTFTINGKEYTVNQTEVNGTHYKYAVLFDVTEDMEEGEVTFTISNIYDKAGNQLADLSNNNTDEKVIIDKTAPELVVDKVVDGISGSADPQVHATDATEFNVVIKLNGEVVRTDGSSETTEGTYSTWYGIGYMADGDYEVIATDKAGNSKTISFKLQRLELTDQKVGANLIDEANNTINNFNSFAIKFNNDITISNYSATNGFRIEYEYSTDGVNYTKSTGTTVSNYWTSVLGSSTTEKYQGSTFTIKAGEPIYYSGTKVGTRWSDIYEAIKATKDTENKVYVRTIFTVVQPTYTKSFTLNEVTYSNGGTEVSPRGLAEF